MGWGVEGQGRVEGVRVRREVIRALVECSGEIDFGAF